MDDHTPILGAIITLERRIDGVALSAFGRGINYVEVRGDDFSGIKAARKQFKKYFQTLKDKLDVDEILVRDYSIRDGALSYLSTILLEAGGTYSAVFPHQINLKLGLEKI